MGKAQIVSGGENGLYTIKPTHKREQIDAEITALGALLEDLNAELTISNDLLDFAELEVAEVRMLVDGLIDIYEEEGALPLVDLVSLVGMHNAARTGLAPLTVSSQLNSAAQGHADWLAANDRSGHTGSGGSTAGQRITASGYPNNGGENVAVGVQPPESAAFAAWMNSPGHRANILRAEYRHIGAGYACRSDGQHRHFWVVVFGLHPESVAGGTPAAPDGCVDSDGNAAERILEAMRDLAKKSMERDVIQMEVDAQEARRASAQDRLDALNDIPEDSAQLAWCVDFTQTLDGEKATIEIPGEGNQRVLLRPGHASGADYEPARDGQLHHRAGMSGPQAYFNASILPGWQRWTPTYRVGVLTAVDKESDTGTVSLDEELSSAQDLPINSAALLSSIPITYMTCNAFVFEPGDRVVVEFPDRTWEAPQIIGFESDPKPCDTVLVRYLVQTVNSRAGLLIEGEATQEVSIGGNATPVTAVRDTRTLALGYMMWFIGWDDGVQTAARHDTNIQEGFTATALRVMFPAKLLLHPGGIPASGVYAFDGALAAAGAMWSNYPSSSAPLGGWKITYNNRSRCDDEEEPTKSVPVFFNYNFATVYWLMGSLVNEMFEGSVTRMPFAGVGGENDCIWESASVFSAGSHPGDKYGQLFWLDFTTVYYWETDVNNYDYDTCLELPGDHAKCSGFHERSSWDRTNPAWWGAVPGISVPGQLQVQHNNIDLLLEYTLSSTLDPDTGYRVYLPPDPPISSA